MTDPRVTSANLTDIWKRLMDIIEELHVEWARRDPESPIEGTPRSGLGHARALCHIAADIVIEQRDRIEKAALVKGKP